MGNIGKIFNKNCLQIEVDIWNYCVHGSVIAKSEVTIDEMNVPIKGGYKKKRVTDNNAFLNTMKKDGAYR